MNIESFFDLIIEKTNLQCDQLFEYKFAVSNKIETKYEIISGVINSIEMENISNELNGTTIEYGIKKFCVKRIIFNFKIKYGHTHLIVSFDYDVIDDEV
jgi:hypothetical protein